MVKKVGAGVRSCWMLVGWDHGSFSPQRAAAIWVTLLATSTPCTQSYKIHTKRTPSASRLLQHIPKASEKMCNSNVLWGWHPHLVSVLGQLSKPVRATSQIVGVKPQTALISWEEILENSLKSQRRNAFSLAKPFLPTQQLLLSAMPSTDWNSFSF